MCNLEGTRLASHELIVRENEALIAAWASGPSQGFDSERLMLGIRRNSDDDSAIVSRQYNPLEQAGYEALYDTLGSGQSCRVLDTTSSTAEPEICQNLLPLPEPRRRRGLCQYTDCYSDSNPAYACTFPFR